MCDDKNLQKLIGKEAKSNWSKIAKLIFNKNKEEFDKKIHSIQYAINLKLSEPGKKPKRHLRNHHKKRIKLGSQHSRIKSRSKYKTPERSILTKKTRLSDANMSFNDDSDSTFKEAASQANLSTKEVPLHKKRILSPYKEALEKSMKEQQMKNKIAQKHQEFAQNLVRLVTADQKSLKQNHKRYHTIDNRLAYTTRGPMTSIHTPTLLNQTNNANETLCPPSIVESIQPEISRMSKRILNLSMKGRKILKQPRLSSAVLNKFKAKKGNRYKKKPPQNCKSTRKDFGNGIDRLNRTRQPSPPLLEPHGECRVIVNPKMIKKEPRIVFA
ncbi:unnamed protein product [Moneuplotes crassus]|uniref:Uncharacterized protein n=1 Tax=Euplotes crassus TaxID=5936 RepID=A0AAD1Y8W2_EUPCR|nr:unnamed protein product [Moneuplotes crassus]